MPCHFYGFMTQFLIRHLSGVRSIVNSRMRQKYTHTRICTCHCLVSNTRMSHALLFSLTDAHIYYNLHHLVQTCRKQKRSHGSGLAQHSIGLFCILASKHHVLNAKKMLLNLTENINKSIIASLCHQMCLLSGQLAPPRHRRGMQSVVGC